MQFFGGGGGSSNSARDKDFARRQDRLAARKQTAKAAPKGQVTVTFPQKNKKTVCQQGQPIGQVASKVRIALPPHSYLMHPTTYPPTTSAPSPPHLTPRHTHTQAGVRIKFDCKNGRCGTCTVRLNGRAAAKICQGARIPGGATKSLSITLDNP